MMIIEKMPVINVKNPISLGKIKFPSFVVCGNPFVVIIRIFVIAKIDTKNEAAAIIVALKM